MKTISLVISVLFLATGCAEKKYFTEVVSDKVITISMREAYNEKYLTLNIPVGFSLNLNHSEIKDVRLYWVLNNKQLADVEDYVVMNAENDRIIYAIEDKEYPNYPKSIYLLNRRNKISKEDALALIKKYNPTATLESIKSRKDTIKLVSYALYRKDNPEFLKEMRRLPDSLIFSIGFSGGKGELFKAKINW
ncbi:MAG: hypothetical protein CFE23_16205 [Flavobacterium sp. BFFFF1]|uniref:hypothetical protein n=1 Tax=Flavobacterium sp. BFFFF1 TaxID=2015557 RepID=UPI000BCD3AC2|nr:hypothetical protein [Flavobacterium sp. BFFFF1]OYU78973.1 MAG: hypothetical protein CFE23_16205 [Flavobacterium sp. BFFFF1]